MSKTSRNFSAEQKAGVVRRYLQDKVAIIDLAAELGIQPTQIYPWEASVFGTTQRRVIRHGNFNSVAALKQKLTQFIDYFNKTFAKPFQWTYTDQPTNAKTVPRALTGKER